MRVHLAAVCGALTLAAAGACVAQEQVLAASDVQFNAKGSVRLFPTEAAKRGLSGHATVTCEANKQGRLQHCRSDSETPQGMGFGVVAVVMAGEMKIERKTRSGVSVAGRRVQFPIAFEWEKGVAGVKDPTIMADAGPGPFDTTGLLRPDEVNFLRRPSGAQMAAVYPARAESARHGGSAVVLCRITASGWLAACRTIAEDRPGEGFGAAAEKLFSLMRVGPETKSGEATSGRPIFIKLEASIG